MRRWVVPSAVLVFAAVGLVSMADSPAGVTATLELSQQFYYAGEPLFVRVSVGNDGEKTVDNPVKGALLAGFSIKRDGKPLEAGRPPADKEPTRPGKLPPKTFYGAIVDLAELFPGLDEPGSYQIDWSSGGVTSRGVTVRLLPKYEPEKDYAATVNTTAGSFTIEFFKNESPIATKAFIDLANAGFYDGLLIHEVRKDRFIAGGDALASEAARPSFLYPAESSSLAVVAGTVVMKPVRPFPPANGSPFMVTLRPEPTWAGQVTVLGQVVKGLDVVRRISQVESNLELQQPFYRPATDIRIESIAVSEKQPAPQP